MDDELVAVDPAGEEAVLDPRLVAQLLDEEQADHNEEQGERKPGQARRQTVVLGLFGFGAQHGVTQGPSSPIFLFNYTLSPYRP